MNGGGSDASAECESVGSCSEITGRGFSRFGGCIARVFPVCLVHVHGRGADSICFLL